MNCIEQTELEQYLKGKLAPERMLAIDEHVSRCADCKSLATKSFARADFGAAVMGAVDCPEYEELSAYVGELLDTERATSIRAHANICEPCTRDIGRITELRSHAAMREKVVVAPGMSRQARRSPFAYWKQALAAVSVAGIAAVALVFGNLGGTLPDEHARVAVNQPDLRVPTAESPKAAEPNPGTPVASLPEKKPVATTDIAKAPAPTAPAVVAVLRDGRYSVIRKNGSMVLAKIDGTSVRTSLEARIAASIDEKLRTGKIKPVKPVMMAMASIPVRSANGYETPQTAPKQIGPMGKVTLSAKPTFTWSAVDLAESYRIRIYNEASNLVVDQIVKKNSFTPATPLPRGHVYAWRVGARFGETDQWSDSSAAKFLVLSTDDYASIAQVRSRLPGSHLALGAAYESVGLYDEAASEYRALRRANPHSKLARKLLYGVAR